MQSCTYVDGLTHCFVLTFILLVCSKDQDEESFRRNQLPSHRLHRSKRDVTMSPEKQLKLEQALSQRRVTPVKSTAPSIFAPTFHLVSSACDVIIFWCCGFLENLTLSRIVKTELARACGESVLQEDDDDVTALRGGDLEESYIAPAQTQSPRPRTMTQQQPSQPVAINVR